MTEKSVFACGYVLEFEEGSSEEVVLHEGTLEECETVGRNFGAVSYSGGRKVKEASFVIVRKS